MTAVVGALLAVGLASAPAWAQARGDARLGADLYTEKCVLCHGAEGAGWDWSKKADKPPVPVPDLATIAAERTDVFLFDVVKGGGEAVGRTRFMPPFGFQLSDEEIWHLVAYVRSLERDAKR
ncbi:MAG: c-type cytochrome [Candidatus Rokuibacteriota bacterium]